MVYRALREGSPVFYDEPHDRIFFTTHGDVTRLLRDRRMGRRVAQGYENTPLGRWELPAGCPTWTRFIRGSFIDLEPPEHTRLRTLVRGAFTPLASERVRTRLEQVADRVIGEAIERGQMEVIADYATEIPVTMIAELMGVPVSDRTMLVPWSHAIVRLFDYNATEDDAIAAEQAATEFVDYLRALLAHRRQTPSDDLISVLAHSEVDGRRLDDDDLIATAILTLNAGHEATVHAVGNAVLALARNPDQLRRLREDPSLVQSAAEEALRFDTPLQMFERWVYEDVEWNGHRLRKGTKIGLLLGAANHDPAVYANPDALDIGRLRRDHLAFGAGIHHCVGAPLARVELQVALAALASRVEELQLVKARPPRLASLVFRGVEELVVLVS